MQQPDSDSSFLFSASDQFNRCMSDDPEFLKNKQRAGLTVDEIAEYRCKREMCYVMRCMAGRDSKLAKRDAFTGKVVQGRKCQEEQEKMYSCIAREKTDILTNLKAGKTVVE